MNNKKPLVVDLDGTLIKSDILVETLLKYLKLDLFNIFRFIMLMFKGKSYVKQEIADNVDIDVSLLPYNQEVLDLITREKQSGREIVLATASNLKYAEQIAKYVNQFDVVIASDSNRNLASEEKANELVSRYGEYGFDYVGNSKADIKVWKKAENAIVVNPDRGVLSKAKVQNNVNTVIENRPSFIQTLLKALRIHQYAKNALIFVPLAASHQLFDLENITTAFVAFWMFSFCASTVYLLNDLLDLEDDRHHKTKCRRPFASGDLDVRFGVILCPAILSVVVAISLLILPMQFMGVLAFYYLATLLYSFKLKRMVMVDVITLATLYTIRIIAGSLALGLSLSFWLLAFSMFIFLSLALVKRYAELEELKLSGKNEARGRGYHPSDLELLSSLGASSGYLSVLILALYINDPKTAALYSEPMYIWLACPLLLYWISRTWMITHRGGMHDDPVVFALKDRVSQVVGGLFILVFGLAI